VAHHAEHVEKTVAAHQGCVSQGSDAPEALAETVRRFHRAADGAELLAKPRAGRPDFLDAYKPSLHDRWNAGITNASTLSTGIEADDLPHSHRFVTGLRRDYDAVRNRLTLPHNSGAVERNVNRIKMIKRQM
jgi:hypothetical protein